MRSVAGMALLLVLCLHASAGADEGTPLDPAARAAKVAGARAAQAQEQADFDDRVNKAIDRGVIWLRAQQRKDGSFPGFSDGLPPNTYSIVEPGLDALVVLTLAHCGGTGDDKDLVKCLNFCRSHYSGKGGLDLKGKGKLTIYVAATLVLALDALYNPGSEKATELKRDRYGNVTPPKPLKCKYPAAIRHWIEELVAFIVQNQVASGGWRYPGNPLSAPEGDTDLSNTQYALLALDAAARCGIRAPAETWVKAAEHLLREQENDGLDAPIWIENEAWEPGVEGPERFTQAGQTLARGWTYLPGENDLVTGSMTAAGVTCVAMCKEHLWLLKKLDASLRGRIDKALLAGLAWLSENFSVTDNPTPGGASMWHYYYLYGLERTGAKVGTRWFGKHDWYREGGEHLLAAQEKSGGWKEPDTAQRPADATESAITQTCFALLFLKRSTRKPYMPMMPPVTGGGAASPNGR